MRESARATAVLDWDSREVIIPNKSFITGRVTNWTLSNQTTRLLIKVGVAYGSDIALVQRVILEVVRRNPDVCEEPPPSVFFADFGDSSLDFEIRAFVDSFDKRVRVRHEINLAVDRVLRENGIEIPFPQRDLHIAQRLGCPARCEVISPASSNGCESALGVETTDFEADGFMWIGQLTAARRFHLRRLPCQRDTSEVER